MALSREEQRLCRAAASTQYQRGHGWGSAKAGLCPIGRVVVARGGTLYLHPSGLYFRIPPANTDTHFSLRLVSTEEQEAIRANWRLIDEVEADVLTWSGYATVGEMTRALIAQGASAFP